MRQKGFESTHYIVGQLGDVFTVHQFVYSVRFLFEVFDSALASGHFLKHGLQTKHPQIIYLLDIHASPASCLGTFEFNYLLFEDFCP
jgi:hypothetical protein